MKLTVRETWALKTMLDFSIARYLMCNSVQRLDAGEKADHHIKMSKIICRMIFAEGGEFGHSLKVGDAWHPVHDYLAEILTDYLDETIGWPLTKPMYGSDYDIYKRRFFLVIQGHWEELEKVAYKAVREYHKDEKDLLNLED